MAISEQGQLQADHVAWWKGNVRGPGRFGNSDRSGLITAEEADKITHISQRQVSRWAAKLKDVDRYQADHVAWWRGAVRDKPGPGRGKKGAQIGAGFLRSDAEEATGITQQQISRWAAKLKDVDRYQADHVAWWKGTVTPNRARKSENADRGYQMAGDGKGEGYARTACWPGGYWWSYNTTAKR